MKIIWLLLMIIGYAMAIPIENDPHGVYLLKNERVDHQDGGYSFAFETSDGQFRRESAHLINKPDQEPLLVIVGSYGYIGPDGVTYAVNYVSDENGFRPEGEHIYKDTFTVTRFDDTMKPPVLEIMTNAIKSLVG